MNNRFSLSLINNFNANYNTNYNANTYKNYYDENKIFYVCSSGGCGSTILFEYLKNFGKVYHIHDRYPPNELEYVGNVNTDKEVYSEWFNGVKIPDNELHKYKVIFIYRNPIAVIYSRFAQANGPNIPHLQHIKCNNNGNINIFDVLKLKTDLYGIESFFDSYTIPTKKNYDIYCIKYELFWNNISLFNKILAIPDVQKLYPVKQERAKKYQYMTELSKIYRPLINKMHTMKFIELIKPIK